MLSRWLWPMTWTQLRERGRIDKEWIKRLPDNPHRTLPPLFSWYVRVIRKQIHDWNDLIKPGVSVITPNPKKPGGARWNYLAAWGYALHHNNNDQAKAQDFVRALYKNVEVLDSGARGSTNTFVERGIGDVPIAWENEACWQRMNWGKINSKSSRRVSLSSQSQPCRWSIKWSRKRHQRGGGSLPEISLLARRSGNCSEKLLPSARR